MSSAAQIAANQANAQRSTGPRTEQGKAATRRNATRHGLCADIATLTSEPDGEADFALLLADLREEHHPDGPTEDILVYKMAEQFFASKRAQILLAKHLDLNDHGDGDAQQVSLMLRYHTTADRGFYRALNELRKLQKQRRQEEIGSVSQSPGVTPPDPPEIAAQPEESAKIPTVQPEPAPLAFETGAVLIPFTPELDQKAA